MGGELLLLSLALSCVFRRILRISKIIIFVTRNNFNLWLGQKLLVVNCFQKKRYLWDTTQLHSPTIAHPSGCELLSKKTVSLRYNTTNETKKASKELLWIAFKNYYLRDTTQHQSMFQFATACCELLSKIIIFVTRHNKRRKVTHDTTVVNCFQKLLSSWHDTTNRAPQGCNISLWIAFKNYYLRDTTQLYSTMEKSTIRCELLSKIIIFVTRHNKKSVVGNCCDVVNCFQKLLSSWHDTTERRGFGRIDLLWIAFKNYYLRDTTQLRQRGIGNAQSCELLSKIIIFVTRHNRLHKFPNLHFVVNCFQKLLSSWHDTTKKQVFHPKALLWIAFKIYYLRDTTQPNLAILSDAGSCELLSKFIIFVTRHNNN